MDNPLISILIPVYNDGAYLPQALDSVLAQTMAEIEIICVDDGSTDNTGTLLAEYAARDSRIRVLTQPRNSGILAARRRAAENASGTYAMFVDADDSLAPRACRTAFDLIRQYDADVLWFSSETRQYDGEHTLQAVMALDPAPVTLDRNLTGDEIMDTYTRWEYSATSLWGKLYRTDVLRRAFARVGGFSTNHGEDVYLSFLIGMEAASFRGVKTEPLYVYNFGFGMCGVDSISVEDFREWCRMAQLPQRIETMLRSEGSWERYGTYCRAMGRRITLDCCLSHFLRLRPEDSREGFAILEEYFGDALRDPDTLYAMLLSYRDTAFRAREDAQWVRELSTAKEWYLQQIESRDKRIQELEARTAPLEKLRALFR